MFGYLDPYNVSKTKTPVPRSLLPRFEAVHSPSLILGLRKWILTCLTLASTKQTETITSHNVTRANETGTASKQAHSPILYSCTAATAIKSTTTRSKICIPCPLVTKLLLLISMNYYR